MKQKNDAGFSLIEVLVAITLLAAIVVPTCSSLIMSFRMNAKTEKMLQAQLAVSSAVETLMAKGIPENYNDLEAINADELDDAEAKWWKTIDKQFLDVTITITKVGNPNSDPPEYYPCYNVKVVSKEDEDVYAETTIRICEKLSLGQLTEEQEGS